MSLGLSVNQMGWVMTAFFITYALLQIPSGQLADRFGNRVVLPLFAVVWSLATAATAFVGGLWGLLVWRLVAGSGQAGLFPGSVIAISSWIGISRRALACGALASSMSVGGAVAVALTGVLLDGIDGPIITLAPLGWRFIFIMFSVPGLLWALWFSWWYRDEPDQHPSVNRAERDLIQSQPPRGSKGETAHDDSCRIPCPGGPC